MIRRNLSFSSLFSIHWLKPTRNHYCWSLCAQALFFTCICGIRDLNPRQLNHGRENTIPRSSKGQRDPAHDDQGESSERHKQSIQEIRDRQSGDMEEVRKMLIGLQTSLDSSSPLVFPANSRYGDMIRAKDISCNHVLPKLSFRDSPGRI